MIKARGRQREVEVAQADGQRSSLTLHPARDPRGDSVPRRPSKELRRVSRRLEDSFSVSSPFFNSSDFLFFLTSVTLLFLLFPCCRQLGGEKKRFSASPQRNVLIPSDINHCRPKPLAVIVGGRVHRDVSCWLGRRCQRPRGSMSGSAVIGACVHRLA